MDVTEALVPAMATDLMSTPLVRPPIAFEPAIEPAFEPPTEPASPRRAPVSSVIPEVPLRSPMDDAREDPEAAGFVDVVVEGARARLSLLMGAALFVLLVACANLAGLSLAARRLEERSVS